MNFRKCVHYYHETLLIKHAEPYQATHFVRYNRVFVVTVIVITELDCNNVMIKYYLVVRLFEEVSLLVIKLPSRSCSIEAIESRRTDISSSASS